MNDLIVMALLLTLGPVKNDVVNNVNHDIAAKGQLSDATAKQIRGLPEWKHKRADLTECTA